MGHNEISPEQKHSEMKRLEREGRWDEANRFKDEVRKQLRKEGKSRAEAVTGSWEVMIEKFPPQPQPETTTDLPDLGGAGDTNGDEDIDVDALMATLGTKESDYFRDITWVYENFGKKKLLPVDAPSLGALNLLNWARRSQNRFFEQILPKAMAEKAKKDREDDDEEEDLCDKTVRKLLKEIQDKAKKGGS